MNLIKISKVSDVSKLPVSTVRHYTNIGLLDVSSQTKGGQYLYDESSSVERLEFIKQLLKRGYDLSSVKEQLSRERKVKKVLILDDNSGFVEGLKIALADVWPAWDVRSNLDVFNAGLALQEFLPDLLLLDMELPGVDGIKICRKIKKDQFLKHIKIIAITAYNTPEHEKAFYDAGADFFYGKPVDIDVLTRKIREVLELKN